jgi:hypothetical protein
LNILVGLLSACNSYNDAWTPPGGGGSSNDVYLPQDTANLDNTDTNDTDNGGNGTSIGNELYDLHCMSCHGTTGTDKEVIPRSLGISMTVQKNYWASL